MKLKLAPSLKIKTFLLALVLFVLSYFFVQLLMRIPIIHGLYETLETFVYFQIFSSTAHPSEHLIIIDEGEKVYDRNSYARLLSGLDQSGAKVIALDVLFPDKRDSSQDAALVNTTQALSNKIIHAIEFVDQQKHAVIPERFQFKTSVKPAPDNYIENIFGAVLPFADLLQAASHLGVVNARVDFAYRDEQYFPMIICYNHQLYPAMPLLAVMQFLGCLTDSLPKIVDDEIELKVNSVSYRIPLNAKSQTLINFIPEAVFAGKYISMEKAFEYIQQDSPLFLDKIVLIGNSFESKEFTHGPHFQSYPNLFLYASLISQILNNEVIREGILESLLFSFLLFMLAINWLFFFSGKFSGLKNSYILLFSFLLLLCIAIFSLRMGVKTYVILPFVIFIIPYTLAKLYYQKRIPTIGTIRDRILPLDYYVSISPRRDRGDTYPVTLISSPAGEDFSELKLKMKEREINKIREQMAGTFKLDIKTMKEFGASLFDALFQPRIRDQFDKSLGMVYTKNTYLRIKLRIDAPDLACYPWEYMYDKDQTKEFLALHKNISVTRFIAVQEPVAPVVTRPPLRILIIISNPDHPAYPNLAVAKEKNLIKEALKNLVSNNLIELQFLKKATLATVARELKRKVDIIHFVGHGGYAEELGGGCLVFEREAKGYELVNIDRFSKLLEKTSIRLVLLNACQTAQVTKSDISIGVAQGLVKIGVPSVIAMQFSIPDSSALEFSKEFYTTLAETSQVDRAVSEARRKMFINLEGGRIDWGIPVLFMRKDDGVIF